MVTKREKRSWGEIEAQIYTPQKIAASKLRMALIEEIVRIRRQQGVTQQRLGDLGGVKQPVIARMERGTTSPHLDTVLKVLTPLGKTLAIIDIES